MSIFDVFKPIVPAYERRRQGKTKTAAPVALSLFGGLFGFLQPVQPTYTSRRTPAKARPEVKRGRELVVRRGGDQADRQEPKP